LLGYRATVMAVTFFRRGPWDNQTSWYRQRVRLEGTINPDFPEWPL
jgi:hypothetical protein